MKTITTTKYRTMKNYIKKNCLWVRTFVFKQYSPFEYDTNVSYDLEYVTMTGLIDYSEV